VIILNGLGALSNKSKINMLALATTIATEGRDAAENTHGGCTRDDKRCARRWALVAGGYWPVIGDNFPGAFPVSVDSDSDAAEATRAFQRAAGVAVDGAWGGCTHKAFGDLLEISDDSLNDIFGSFPTCGPGRQQPMTVPPADIFVSDASKAAKRKKVLAAGVGVVAALAGGFGIWWATRSS
jgi:hypothetical protein